MARKARKFNYRERSKDQVRKRAEGTSGFDSMIKDQFRTFRPKEGSYEIRILPPTWDDADHFGMDVYVHYSVGAEDTSYICPQRTFKEPCPICEARKEALDNEDEETARSLNSTHRVVVWIVDRDNEKEGPLVWFMPLTIDKELADLSYDERDDTAIAIDHPYEGYDVRFNREGAGLKTQYRGIKTVRDPSAISEDDEELEEWLDFIEKNPLPDALNVFDYDYLDQVFNGKKSRRAEEEEEKEERPRRSRPRREDPEEEDIEEAEERSYEDEEEEEEERPRNDMKKRLAGIRGKHRR